MKIAFQICSRHEWKSIKQILGIKPGKALSQPFGQYFKRSINGHTGTFYQSGDTKTRSSAACQYVINRWHPDAIVNLGTCGGVSSKIQKLDLIMADRTVQYDCIIRFGEKRELFYRPMITVIDTSWVDLGKVKERIRKGTIATADQDLDCEWRGKLQRENVLGADWESGAIAKVCKLNDIKCLILRGVSDIPKEDNPTDQEAQASDFERNTPLIMRNLLRIISQISFA
jgi:adenosylhomocysteine nucleosidase/adenosylhomocysteine/aminodeoxyfutalosine nucleosidase